MPKMPDSASPVTVDEIVEMADRGEDVSRSFKAPGKIMPQIQRVNVDFTLLMLEELDRQAVELNISRQAVIKTLLRQGLDQRYIAHKAS